CDCSSATSHSRYVNCVADVTNQAVSDGSLREECAEVVVGCASQSTCGRAGAVTCCQTDAAGNTTCSIKRRAGFCRPPRGGSACVGEFPSCCDACEQGGYVPAGSTTTTEPPPPTTTTSTVATASSSVPVTTTSSSSSSTTSSSRPTTSTSSSTSTSAPVTTTSTSSSTSTSSPVTTTSTSSSTSTSSPVTTTSTSSSTSTSRTTTTSTS